MKNESLNDIENEVIDEAMPRIGKRKHLYCPDDKKLEFAMRLFLVNPMSNNSYNTPTYIRRINDELLTEYVSHDYVIELVNSYCKIQLAGDLEDLKDLKDKVTHEIDTVILRIYSDMIDEWWDEGIDTECEANYDDEGD